MKDKELIVNECLTKLIAVCALEKMKCVVAQNENKWITIHPHGKDGGDGESKDYRRLLIKDGETVEDAMHRQGYYNKRQAKDEKKEKVEKDNKYLYLNDEEISDIVRDNFNGKSDLISKAFKNAYKDESTDKIIRNLHKLGKINYKKVGLDKGVYIPSIIGESATIKADTENTFYHEFGHSLDHRLGRELDKGNPKFNWLSNDLTGTNTEIIKKLNYTLPKDLEDKFKNLSNKINQDFTKKYIDSGILSNEMLEVARNKYKDFDNLPIWLKSNILDEEGTKITKKYYEKIVNADKDYKKWSVLSNIYSALTMGKDKRDKFLGAHSQEYWEDAGLGIRSGKSANINSEIFANYVEMRMGNFIEQLRYLKDNEPKLYKQLDLLYYKVATEIEKL